MTTIICRRPGDHRTLAEKQEAALLAAFRKLAPRDQVRTLRQVRSAMQRPAPIAG